MNLKLIRSHIGPTGVFGTLLKENTELFCYTAEHSYLQNDGTWKPKITKGEYLCIFGHHQLDHGPVDTFEITGIEGHSGILIHVGNYPQKDSDGCLLIGQENINNESITNSRATFEKFLEMQNKVSFTLTVEDA
jgi:hypothetical protein